MKQLAVKIERITARLQTLEERIFENKSDYQPAPVLCKKYQISRSLRDRLIRERLIKEYRLFGKIFFKCTSIEAFSALHFRSQVHSK